MRAAVPWVALALLIIIGLGAYIYLDKRAEAYRYLFPGLIGFGLFVIFPLLYTVVVSLTRYSSSNLLPYERALSLFQQDTISAGGSAYNYKLLLQPGGDFRLYLEDDKNSSRRFISDPFELNAQGSRSWRDADPTRKFWPKALLSRASPWC